MRGYGFCPDCLEKEGFALDTVLCGNCRLCSDHCQCEDPDFWSEMTLKIKEKARCCACSGPLGPNHVNVMILDREAQWPQPTWGNVEIGLPAKGAVAFLCDKCIAEKRKPRFAVEASRGWEAVTYHPVEELPELEVPG